MGLVALQRVGSSPGEVSVSAHPHICVLLVLASLDFLFHAIWDLPGSLNSKQLVLNCVLAKFHIMSWNPGSYWNPMENSVSWFVFFFVFFKQVTNLQWGRPGFDPWIGKILWRRERLPTPVFSPGEVRGLCSPWGCKESDMTEWLLLSL